jgi:hypothetical protein
MSFKQWQWVDRWVKGHPRTANYIWDRVLSPWFLMILAVVLGIWVTNTTNSMIGVVAGLMSFMLPLFLLLQMKRTLVPAESVGRLQDLIDRLGEVSNELGSVTAVVRETRASAEQWERQIAFSKSEIEDLRQMLSLNPEQLSALEHRDRRRERLSWVQAIVTNAVFFSLGLLVNSLVNASRK